MQTMKSPRMVFQFPSTRPDPARLQDGAYDTLIVDEGEEGAVDAAVADGWYLSPMEARAAAEGSSSETVSDAPATRAELEAKATELGIKFDGRSSDKTIAAAIEAALKV